MFRTCKECLGWDTAAQAQAHSATAGHRRTRSGDSQGSGSSKTSHSSTPSEVLEKIEGKDADVGKFEVRGTRDLDILLFNPEGQEARKRMTSLKINCKPTVEHMEAISKMTTLEDLDLRGVHMGGDIVILLAPNRLPANLKSLNLSHNGLKASDARHLCKPNVVPPNVTEMNLSHNEFGPQGGEILFKEKESPISRLTHLDLSHNGLGHSVADHCRPGVFSPNLQLLHLEKNAIGDNGLQALSTNSMISGRVLGDKLLDINLTENNITESGVKAFVKARTPNLQHLTLSGNYIQSEGVGAILSAPFASKLKHLNLAYCETGPEAADMLIAAGKKANKVAEDTLTMGSLVREVPLCKLEKLIMSHNKFGSDGVNRVNALNDAFKFVTTKNFEHNSTRTHNPYGLNPEDPLYYRDQTY